LQLHLVASMLLQAELAALKLETGLNRNDRTPASETSPGDLTIEVKRVRLKMQHRGMELLGKTQQVQELQQQLEALKQAMASLEAMLAQQHSTEQQVPEALASTATKVLQEHVQVQQVLPQLQEVQEASQQQQPQQQDDDGGSQAQSEPAVHPPGQPQPQQQQGGGDLQPAPAVVARLRIQQQGRKAQSKTQQPHRSQKPQTQQ
jgi:cysteinyl-tRNA synthetase